ncbi:hypothetical protein C8034_v011984 [Colletotrichum sidae]|uniref:Glycoside hydrolase n=1 Tax=Colletotrichum sidae TaxID=1347389 RepID=A0A4R8TKQ3_9PEZI|nr:hypothetical protein C8034_v011984 [Colletotrichum sidae]
MVFQLPSAVDPDAVGVIFYSFLCLLANIVLVWLTWTHNDRTSYIACISYATLVVTATSIAQQFYDFAFWKDIMTDQFYYARDNADNAEVQYHKGARGIKLILSYIRIFGFTIESTFVFFFALSLAASVYGWFATTPRTTHTISIIGRVVPCILTCITIGLMNSPPAQSSFITYMLVANTQFVLSLLGSAVLLIMILFKYVRSRYNLQTWNVLYGNAGSLPTSSAQGSKARSAWLGSSSSRGGGRSRAYSGAGANKTYDSWLVIRLSIAFAVLCVFEYTNVVPRIAAATHTVDSTDDLAPDLSVKRALSSVRGYVSGVTPSLVAFLVFGTTKAFQRKIVDTFIPKRLQPRRRHKKNLSISFGNSGPSPHLPATQRPIQPVDSFSLSDMAPKYLPTSNYSPHFQNEGELSPRQPYHTHTKSNSRDGTPRFATGPLSPKPVPSSTVAPSIVAPSTTAPSTIAPSTVAPSTVTTSPSPVPPVSQNFQRRSMLLGGLSPPPRPKMSANTHGPRLNSKFSVYGRPEGRHDGLNKTLPEPPYDGRAF